MVIPVVPANDKQPAQRDRMGAGPAVAGKCHPVSGRGSDRQHREQRLRNGRHPKMGSPGRAARGRSTCRDGTPGRQSSTRGPRDCQAVPRSSRAPPDPKFSSRLRSPPLLSTVAEGATDETGIYAVADSDVTLNRCHGGGVNGRPFNFAWKASTSASSRHRAGWANARPVTP